MSLAMKATCRIDGCDRQINARAMCSAHYQRWRKTGVEGGDVQRYRRSAVCSVRGCQRVSHAQTLCNSHYQSHVRRLGVGPGTYDALYDAQQGLCAICGSRGVPRPGEHAELCMDHDHRTGKIRGLLCHSCNRALGLLGDDYERLLRAAEYLLEHRHAAG